MHTWRSSPPLVQEKHLMPFVQHQSHCSVLTSADMIIPTCFGMWVRLALGVLPCILPLVLVAWLHGRAGASLGSLGSLISLSPSSSAVVSSSLGLSPRPRLAFITTWPFI